MCLHCEADRIVVLDVCRNHHVLVGGTMNPALGSTWIAKQELHIPLIAALAMKFRKLLTECDS